MVKCSFNTWKGQDAVPVVARASSVWNSMLSWGMVGKPQDSYLPVLGCRGVSDSFGPAILKFPFFF